MKTGRGFRTGRARFCVLAVLVALTQGWSPSPAAGQADAPEREPCRCVDAAGDPIEECVCVRLPRADRLDRSLARARVAGLDRPRIGLSVDPSSPSASPEGARVVEVMEGGPAAAAGLRAGDVITAFDGHRLTEPLEAEVEDRLDPDGALPEQRLLALARELDPGQRVDIEYEREGERGRTEVVAEDLGSLFGRGGLRIEGWDSEAFERRMEEITDRIRDGVRMAPRPGAGPYRFRFEQEGGDGPLELELRGSTRPAGLRLVPLNPDLGSYFGAESGVLVVDLDEDAGLGLRPGDVVLEVGDRPVRSPLRMYRILDTYDRGEAVNFRIRRDDREMEVSGRMPG